MQVNAGRAADARSPYPNPRVIGLEGWAKQMILLDFEGWAGHPQSLRRGGRLGFGALGRLARAVQIQKFGH